MLKFKIGQKVWDRYSGNAGIIYLVANQYYYYVDYGFGICLSSETDLEDFSKATTYRNGIKVKVSDVFKQCQPN